jgi:hypothetical protein
VKRLPILVVLGLLIVAVAAPMAGGELGFGGSASPSAGTAQPTASSGAARAAGSLEPAETEPGTDTTGGSEPSADPGTEPEPSTTPLPIADVPVVPVTHFRSTQTKTNRAEVADVLAGRSDRYEALELVAADADAILAALGMDHPSDPARLILAKGPVTLGRDMAKTRDRLGFLRANKVTPAVRALAWGPRTLFGNDRVRDLDDWRLFAELAAAPEDAFDPGATWTMVAGGDIMLDRGVAETLKIKGKGADFPFDGGTAEITGHCEDCSPLGWDLPYTRRTGNAGAIRELVEGADLAIANFENPAPNKFSYHTSGLRFSADPKLIKGLATAGIDWVSLANNHIGDAGGNGITQTIRNLRDYGIKSSGAGKNLKAARKPAVLEAGAQKVAFLAYDTIAGYYTADADTAGSARMTQRVVRNDVRRARKAGADIVIVFPHWGSEYDPSPFARQQALAHAAIDAGADMVIGNHAHWAAAMEVHEGRPIWYALGNFVFDQTWSEPTMEGITLELTFHGKDLVQARMRPHIILDKAQPNFLAPAGDGRVVMGQIFGASNGLLPW